ncbi:hypothetical protein C3F09_07660 [candidate division GN15 bacterium]|uniref:Anti-sigma-28 factor FlgM C-terminal domain-containing protein n=1 Tax=candidate division GN15 bacterium TaxID=2072418 RepID=A0A855X6B8_9BACT|nr:MAG: hypothetical protein C3F09_07660 [candidate division GN15 bacterium]
MNMGRTPHRKPSSDNQVQSRETVTGGESTREHGAVSSLKHLSTAADAARRDLMAGGDINPVARSLGSRRARMEDVRRKVAEGYYNRQEIRQQIADRLADNLNP